jgi:phosphoribosylformimino-5-aminoimidazole carboxamide ribotide isomerase
MMAGQDDLHASVVGVLDLREGLAVHAMAGQRDKYAPIQLADRCSGDVASLLSHYRQLGIRHLYVADLDAIVNGNSHSQKSLERIAQYVSEQQGVAWLDAGLCQQPLDWIQQATQDPKKVHAVIGTESLSRGFELESLRDDRGHTLTVSLDLRDGNLIWRDNQFHTSLSQFTDWLHKHHWREWIVLDIKQVGMSRGATTAPLCRELHDQYPLTTLISGGGVRGWNDVRCFRESGCQYVLAATWLHQSHPN